MATLLILGSKPEPALPPRAAYQALACANASGFSAARHGLPTPAYTVMTAVLTSGKAEDNHSLKVLRGLETRTLYFLPRPEPRGRPARRLLTHLKQWRLKPFHMRRCPPAAATPPATEPRPTLFTWRRPSGARS